MTGILRRVDIGRCAIMIMVVVFGIIPGLFELKALPLLAHWSECQRFGLRRTIQ